MIQIPVHDLRRVAASLESLDGERIVTVRMRSDFRQLKMELADGSLLVIGVTADEAGRSHLDVDLVRSVDSPVRSQLEVGIDQR